MVREPNETTYVVIFSRITFAYLVGTEEGTASGSGEEAIVTLNATCGGPSTGVVTVTVTVDGPATGVTTLMEKLGCDELIGSELGLEIGGSDTAKGLSIIGRSPRCWTNSSRRLSETLHSSGIEVCIAAARGCSGRVVVPSSASATGSAITVQISIIVLCCADSAETEVPSTRRIILFAFIELWS